MDRCTLKREQDVFLQPFLSKNFKKAGLGVYDEDIFNVLKGILTLKMQNTKTFWPFNLKIYFDGMTDSELKLEIMWDDLHDIRIEPNGEISIVYNDYGYPYLSEMESRKRIVNDLSQTIVRNLVNLFDGNNTLRMRCDKVCTLLYVAQLNGIRDGENARYSSDWRHFYSLCKKELSFKIDALADLAVFLNTGRTKYSRTTNNPIIEGRNRFMQDEYFSIKKALCEEVDSDTFIQVSSDVMNVWCFDMMMDVLRRKNGKLAKRIDEFLAKAKEFDCFVETENEIKSDIFASFDFL